MTHRGGVVLAGGKSRRFGTEEKAVAEVEGEPMLLRVVNRLATAVDDVVVSCRPEQRELFARELTSTPVTEIVVDTYPGRGPIAGIEAGFTVLSNQYIGVVACDMPFVDPAVFEELFDRLEQGTADAVVPEDAQGNLQPVQAVYRKAPMQAAVSDTLPEEASLHAVLDALTLDTVSKEGFSDRSFYNVNTKSDLLAAQRGEYDG